MNRIFPSLLLFLFPLISLAQQADSLRSDSLLPELQTRTITVEIPRYGFDKMIDEGFAPFGNAVEAFVFYTFDIGEDILYGLDGNTQPGEGFHKQPPFQVEFSDEADVPIDRLFRVKGQADGSIVLSYDKQDSLSLGKSLQLDGGKLIVTRKAISDKGKVELELQFRGDAKIFESVSLEAVAISYDSKPEDAQDFIVSYLSRDVIAADRPASVDGFDFNLRTNANSNFDFSDDLVYTFQITRVTFLPFVILILLVGALFFTVYFRFVNIRQFLLAINVVRGKYSDPDDEGEVSHFQALTAALSGTVGLGNIAGVAIAISIGGAGATFWMILAGLLGMSSKFVECTLGVKYRIVKKGVVSGGPMYYLSRGLDTRGLGKLGKVLAALFSVMCIGASFGAGNMFQVNQAFLQVSGLDFVKDTWLASNGWLFGLIVAILVALVIIGGIKSIARVTDKIVPFMTGSYVLAALFIIFMNFTDIPSVFMEIIMGAFAPTAIAGGFIGVLIQGLRRAAFSNEAGVGSASIAHSAVKTKYPASEGIVSLLEPFIDTVVVCTMTALVIIITDNHLNPNASDGVALTSRAFSAQMPFFKYVLSVAVILFAFSTMITWSYYGLKSWTYLFGNNRSMDVLYKVIFCSFIVVGAASSMGSVVGFSDAMILAMAGPNIIGLIILRKDVVIEFDRYLKRIKELSVMNK